MTQPTPSLPSTHPCPRCNRQLRADGELSYDGIVVAVALFSCPECLDTWCFEGEYFEHALTFAVDADGNVLEPDTLTPVEPTRWA